MSKYPNSGTLGRNEKRETEKHPEFKGKAEVAGVEYWLSAWVKEGPTGKFFSLSFTPKDEAHKQGMQQAKSSLRDTLPDDGFQDDIPF